jgi:hypothetical protein
MVQYGTKIVRIAVPLTKGTFVQSKICVSNKQGGLSPPFYLLFVHFKGFMFGPGPGILLNFFH